MSTRYGFVSTLPCIVVLNTVLAEYRDLAGRLITASVAA
jgi:hypothetical protein